MSITRRMPPIVAQTLEDSCWAAVLESWSRVDPQIPDLRQDALVRRWGEGPTGGITPVRKIPAIAETYGLAWGGFPSSALEGYLRQHLPRSHVFCAYTRGTFTHAVLIYLLSGRRNISYMDPDDGHYRWRPLSWFLQRGDYALMRKR